MLNTTLMKIGLTKRETEIYLILLKLEEATASEIAKKTEESRTHVYDNINTLLEKGLISYVIKSNRRYFKTAPPEKLLEYLNEKELKIEEEKKEVSKMLPQLKSLKLPTQSKPRIEVYEGKEGLKTLMNDIVNTGKSFVGWGATKGSVEKIVPSYILERYLRERERKNIRGRQLYSKGTEVLKTPMSEFKEVPKEYSSPSTTVVYGDKVTIWLWLETPTFIKIESKELAKSYKQHFELMWKAIK